MTIFERRGLAAIARVLLKDVLPHGTPAGGFALRVDEIGGHESWAYRINFVSFSRIDVREETTAYKYEIWNEDAHGIAMLKLKNKERSYNEIFIEKLDTRYIEGRDSRYRFKIDVKSESEVDIEDYEIGTTVHYRISNN